jgi:mannose-6-phosphate isomerase-like protein (cupin superfamily)
MKPFNIADTFVALEQGSRARPLPVNEDFWPALIGGRLGPVHRLLSCLSFSKDWSTWERHPAGEEFVCLLEGEVELHLENEGGTREVVVLDQPGAFVLVPPNTWHTAKVRRPARMLFVTPGEGTQNRPDQT